MTGGNEGRLQGDSTALWEGPFQKRRSLLHITPLDCSATTQLAQSVQVTSALHGSRAGYIKNGDVHKPLHLQKARKCPCRIQKEYQLLKRKQNTEEILEKVRNKKKKKETKAGAQSNRLQDRCIYSLSQLLLSSVKIRRVHITSRRSPPACDKGMQTEVLQFIICCL